MKYIPIKLVTLILIIGWSFSALANSEYKKKMIKEINLNGLWKFSIMNNTNWEQTNYNDSDWDELIVPRAWEGQGYNDYNGYGFYRKQIFIEEDLIENQLYLMLGYIDDVDEVYFNGELIGSTGSFPPHYKTAYDARRSYLIPASLIKAGQKNTIAVKVLDMGGLGGITKGDIGIYMQEFPIKPAIDLIGEWKFKIRNNPEYKFADYDDSEWDEIMVPGVWENQGYREFNGTAWYRKDFYYNGSLSDKKMVLLLGKVDDIEQVFLNGEWIGQTGHNSYFKTGRMGYNNYHLAERAYIFPAELLKDGKNVIAVKVIDGQGVGGIYDGRLELLLKPNLFNTGENEVKILETKRTSDGNKTGIKKDAVAGVQKTI